MPEAYSPTPDQDQLSDPDYPTWPAQSVTSESAAIQPSPEQPTQTVWSAAYFDKVKDYINQTNPENGPELLDTVERTFQEFDHQMIDNLHTQEANPDKFPQTKYATTTVSITPEIIAKIFPDHNIDLAQFANQQPDVVRDIIMVGGFSLPPGGHPLDYSDGALDRFIIELNAAATKMANGEYAATNIKIMGNPIAHGGQVGSNWEQALKDNGMDAFGQLYQDQIEQELLPPGFSDWPEEQQYLHMLNHEFVGQGNSGGAGKVESLFNHLPQPVQDKAILRLDNPVAHHTEVPVSWLRKSKIAGGIIGETVRNMLLDDLMKSLGSHSKELQPQITQRLNRDIDTPTSQIKNMNTFRLEAQALIKGNGPREQAVKRILVSAQGDMLTSDPFARRRVQHKIDHQPDVVPFYEQRNGSLTVINGAESHFLDSHSDDKRTKSNLRRLSNINRLLS